MDWTYVFIGVAVGAAAAYFRQQKSPRKATQSGQVGGYGR